MTEHKFIRDPISNAVLNTNINAMEQYKIEKTRLEKEQNTLKECLNDINILKEDMKDIKNLLIKMNEN